MAPPRGRSTAQPFSTASERQHDNSIVASVLLYAEQDWDSSPIKMPGWVARLEKDAPSANPAFDALVKHGYVTNRNSVACVSSAHAAALEDPHPRLLAPRGRVAGQAAPVLLRHHDGHRLGAGLHDLPALKLDLLPRDLAHA